MEPGQVTMFQSHITSESDSDNRVIEELVNKTNSPVQFCIQEYDICWWYFRKSSSTYWSISNKQLKFLNSCSS